MWIMICNIFIINILISGDSRKIYSSKKALFQELTKTENVFMLIQSYA